LLLAGGDLDGDGDAVVLTLMFADSGRCGATVPAKRW
jgi:hypothetical protein